MKSFISAKPNRGLIGLAHFLFPVLLKAMQNIHEIVISDEDRQMLKSLKDKRLLLFTNHPTTAEPPITFYMGKLIGDNFTFMASRQVFNWNFGLIGPAIRRLGAYSVIAGTTDREAMKASRAAIAKEAGKLIIFPEGEPTSGENDTIMPFQGGVAQLGLWGLEDARKADPNADVTVLPGFIKFVIAEPREKIEKNINKILSKLEKKLQIDATGKSILRRFLTIGRILLEQLEEEYNIEVKDPDDFDYRVGRVRHALLDDVADKLQVHGYDRDADAIVKLRKLFSVVEMLQVGYPDKNLPKASKKEIKWAHWKCVQAFDFIVIKKDYITSKPAPERLYEWLDRYESLVFKKTPRALGGTPSHLKRKAHVFFAKPFLLSEYVGQSKAEKKEKVKELTGRIRKDIEDLLQKSDSLTEGLFAAEDV